MRLSLHSVIIWVIICPHITPVTTAVADDMQPVILQTGEVIDIDNGLVRLSINEDGRLQELFYRGGPIHSRRRR